MGFSAEMSSLQDDMSRQNGLTCDGVMALPCDLYSQLIMYNSIFIPKARNFEDILQTTTADNCRVGPCNIYHNHNTRHIHMHC